MSSLEQLLEHAAAELPELEADLYATPQQRKLAKRHQFTESASLDNAPQKFQGRRGIYQIFRAGRLIYNGKALDLGQRLGQHRWCLSHLKIPTTGYTVRVALLPGRRDPSIRKVEQAHRAIHPRALKHQNLREFELALDQAAREAEFGEQSF